MSAATAFDILVGARQLLEPRGAWTKSTFARNEIGSPVGWMSDSAVRFCLAGAVYRSQYELSVPFGSATARETCAAVNAAIGDRAWSAFNDASPDKRRVMAALNEAIRLAREETA